MTPLVVAQTGQAPPSLGFSMIFQFIPEPLHGGTSHEHASKAYSTFP